MLEEQAAASFVNKAVLQQALEVPTASYAVLDRTVVVMDLQVVKFVGLGSTAQEELTKFPVQMGWSVKREPSAVKLLLSQVC